MHLEPSFPAFITNVGGAQVTDGAKLQTMVALQDTPGPKLSLCVVACCLAAFPEADVQAVPQQNT